MNRNTFYVFEDLNSTGIDKVPLNSPILIEDSGNGSPKTILLTDKTGITNSTTITQLLLLTSQWGDISSADTKVDKSFTRTDNSVGTMFMNPVSEHTKGLAAFTGMVGIRLNNLYNEINMTGRMEIIISEPFVEDRTFIISGHWDHNINAWDEASCIELTKSTTPMVVNFAKNDVTNDVWVLFGGLDTVRANTRVSIINILSSYAPTLDLSFDILPVTSLENMSIDYAISDTRLKDISDLVALFNPSEYDKKTSKKNGFVSDSDAHELIDLDWNESTKTLSITRKAGVSSYGIYCNDVLYTITSDITYEVEPLAIYLTPGLHYVYFEGGVLKDTMSFSTDLLLKHTLVTMIYATVEMTKEDEFGNTYTEYKSIAQFEAHGSSKPGWDHLLEHLAIGAEYESGLNLVLTLGDGSLDTHCEIGITSGYTQDEDLRHTYPIRTSTTSILKYYRNGDYWDLDEHRASVTYNQEWSGNPLYYIYNPSTETYDIGTLTSGEIQLIHIFAIPRIPTPQVICVIGEGKYANIADASVAAIIRPNLNPLPAPEYKLLYTIAIEAGSFGNDYKAKIIPFSDGSTHVDWREITKGIPTSNAPTLQNASDISVALTPTNYTPSDSTVEGHLIGINSAITSQSIQKQPIYFKRYLPLEGTTTATGYGLALTSVGTATAKTHQNTNGYTRMPNTMEFLQATASATTTANVWVTPATGVFGEDGVMVKFSVTAGVAIGASNTSHRFALGVCENTPITTDIDPSTKTSCILLGYDATDINIQIMHNDISGVCTKIDTGWPKPSTDRTSMFTLSLWSTYSNSAITWNYEAVYYDGAYINSMKTNGSITTNYPSFLNYPMIAGAYISAGGVSAVKGLGMGSIGIEGYII